MGDILQVHVSSKIPKLIARFAYTPMYQIATDLTINLWDLGSGRKIKTMIGHTAPINSLSFSACTTMLVSGSSDWTVRCWDVKAAGGVPLKPSRLGGALPEHGMDETRVET
jgi:transcription initiation factor TFIID subunit 5